MDFKDKIQELRRQRELTQDELAASLYVSRTAISKWESGRGYPNIESLKAMAKFFGVTVDELLSGDELITLAEADGKRRAMNLIDLTFGFLDLCAALLFFLPFFSEQYADGFRGVGLVFLGGGRPYLIIAYYSVVCLLIISGILLLALQNLRARLWVASKGWISLLLGACAVLLFIVSSQPYAAVFSFALFMIKGILLIKR